MPCTLASTVNVGSKVVRDTLEGDWRSLSLANAPKITGGPPAAGRMGKVSSCSASRKSAGGTWTCTS